MLNSSFALADGWGNGGEWFQHLIGLEKERLMNYFNQLFIIFIVFVAFAFISVPAFSQEANYDESKVPAYKLPDPLLFVDGTKVSSAEAWTNKRRAEVIHLFEEHVYGKTPDKKLSITYKKMSEEKALDGIAIRKQIALIASNSKQDLRIEMLIYLPADAPKPVPMFLGLNFDGNHTICADPGIKISQACIEIMKRNDRTKNTDPETMRGTSSSRWAIDKILDRGYGLATIFYGDIDPDYDDGFQNGIHPLFYTDGQTKPGPDEWGSIGAWAWGLSRALDYFETDSDIDHKRVAVIGHSRLGKTSLWAGAQDTRFAFVISNNSGCGGAALSRRQFGETVARINTSFPHWFCDNFNTYNNNEDQLPVDQHILIALIAPRPVYVASAQDDRWADPKGEFLSAKYADPVYQLLGTEGLGVTEMPDVNQPAGNTIGYHIRTGKHDVTDYDWEQYLDFADRNVR